MRLFIFFIVFITLGLFVAQGNEEDEPATFSIDILSMEIANKIVIAAVKDCAKRGYEVSAAVVSGDGNLLAFIRSPFAPPHTILATQKKAYSAASVQARTSQMSHRPDLKFAPGLLLIGGGVPIQFNGKFYGGAAVGGAPPEIDEKCADAGIAVVKEIMDFVE